MRDCLCTCAQAMEHKDSPRPKEWACVRITVSAVSRACTKITVYLSASVLRTIDTLPGRVATSGQCDDCRDQSTQGPRRKRLRLFVADGTR